MKRPLLALASFTLALGVACGGLLYNQGNAFPCDYRLPENERDKACAPTEVCGVLGQCIRFVYEGPQFEGTPNLPEFGAGTKVHPKTLDGPITAVTANGSQQTSLVVIKSPSDGGTPVSLGIKLGALTLLSDSTASPTSVRQLALADDTNGGELLLDETVSFLDGTRPSQMVIAKGLRSGPGFLAVLKSQLGSLPTAFLVDTQLNGTAIVPNLDGGTPKVLDLRWPPAARKGASPDPRPILLTRLGFGIQDEAPAADGGVAWRALTTEDDIATMGIFLGNPRPQRLLLRHDVGGDLWAFARGKTGLEAPTVLSTWLLTRRNESPQSMARVWNDCTPCINSRILAIAPNRDGISNVEVLCASGSVNLSLNLVRVIGSASADPADVCVTEPVSPAFDLSHATVVTENVDDAPVAGMKTGRLVIDDANGGGVLVGGKNGEVWKGPSFSHALPAFLERVPLSVGSFPSGTGEEIPLAVTDQYLAAPIDAQVGDAGLPAGFKVFDVRKTSDFVLNDDERVRALVGQARGWALLNSGDLIHLDVRAPGEDGGVLGSGSFFSLDFGPRLVTARGEQTRAPFFGEAVTRSDGGMISLVLTGDDSVYLVPAPEESTARNALPVAYPQLTPEPGSPIRSFALERTPIGTNGVDRVRGYAVTSRNLYVVSLSGEPARWSATPIVLGGGEPLEVWMDNPRGGLARVGYRDGTIYSLPGGFLLAHPGENGEPSQVLDYENLGGWPIAYAASGLWEAHYDVLPTGKLDNKLPDGRPGKPMVWRKVTMPDGSEPWMAQSDKGPVARPGLLHVLVGPPQSTGTGAAVTQTFKLSLYLDTAVYEVGSMTRKNQSSPKP